MPGRGMGDRAGVWLESTPYPLPYFSLTLVSPWPQMLLWPVPVTAGFLACQVPCPWDYASQDSHQLTLGIAPHNGCPFSFRGVPVSPSVAPSVYGTTPAVRFRLLRGFPLFLPFPVLSALTPGPFQPVAETPGTLQPQAVQPPPFTRSPIPHLQGLLLQCVPSTRGFPVPSAS